MRRILTSSVLLFVGASLLACARNREAAPGAANPAPAREHADDGKARQEFTGIIVVSGTEQVAITTLQREAHGPVRLVGALEGELRHLASAMVRVSGEGARTTGFPGEMLDVRSYEVLSIDGQHPYVGVLIVRADGAWLAAADTLRLAAVPDLLREQAGAKVWIIGPATPGGREVRVQSYGVIRPARP